MKASDLFVRALEREGVEFVFGLPGEENLDLLESLSGSLIKLIVARHEQSAGFMAATYGRLTGKAGVCLSTLGPGAANLVTAAAYAQLGGMPMVMVTGQKPIKSSKQGLFQIIDIVDMMQPLTKYAHQIVSGDNIPSRVREAFRVAEEERPGAVHLELPEDIAQEHSDMQPLDPGFSRRPIAEVKAVRAAAERIHAAKRPILVIGAGANRYRTCRMLRQFVERTGIPFVTTQMGKGVVDESGPRCVGNAAVSSGDYVHQALDCADVVINVGHDIVEKPPFFMRPGGPDVVHVHHYSAVVDPVYFPQFEVVGDIANSVWQLMESLEVNAEWDFAPFLECARARIERSQQQSQDDRFPMHPARLVSDVWNVMPEDGIIALDNGAYKIWFARSYPARQPNTVLLDNALAAMGAGLPSAMAAHLVYPDRKVLSVCGDGGFMMNAQELETAVRLNMNLTVLVLRDDAYGMIKWKQHDMGFADFGLDFGNPDFVAFAESFGAHGYRVESAKGFRRLLGECLEREGVHVVDVQIDYSENKDLVGHEMPDWTA